MLDLPMSNARRPISTQPTPPGGGLPDLITAFEAENQLLLEALRVFGISNQEYERAMRALSPSSTTTTVSTKPISIEGEDAVVE